MAKMESWHIETRLLNKLEFRPSNASINFPGKFISKSLFPSLDYLGLPVFFANPKTGSFRRLPELL
jgi:hypothetical protein